MTVTTVTVYAHDDAYVDEDYPDTNYNGDHLYITYGRSPDFWKFAVFRFARPSDCGTATSCILTIPIRGWGINDEDFLCYVESIVGDWTEASVTFNIAYDLDWYWLSQPDIIIPPGATSVSVDVTRLFNARLGDFTFLFDTDDSFDSADYYIDLESKEYGLGAYLTITYDAIEVGPVKHAFEDMYIDNHARTTNFGAADVVRIGWCWYDEAQTEYQLYHPMWKFDFRDVRSLEDAPTGGTLFLYIAENTLSESAGYSVWRNTVDWDESTSTYEDGYPSSSSPFVYFTVAPGQTGWLEIDISAIIVNNYTLDTLSLGMYDHDSYVQSGYVGFASRESGNGAYIKIVAYWPGVPQDRQVSMFIPQLNAHVFPAIRRNGKAYREAYMDTYHDAADVSAVHGLETEMYLPSGQGASENQFRYLYLDNYMLAAFDLTQVGYVSRCVLHMHLLAYQNNFQDNTHVTARISEVDPSWTDDSCVGTGWLRDKDSPMWVDIPTIAQNSVVDIDITPIMRHAVSTGRTQIALKIAAWNGYPTGTYFKFGTVQGGQPAWLEIDDSEPVNRITVAYASQNSEIDQEHPTWNSHNNDTLTVQYTNYVQSAFVKFDFSNLGYAIKSATLTFYVMPGTNLGASTEYSLYIDGLIAAYDETVNCWSNPPSGYTIKTITVPLRIPYSPYTVTAPMAYTVDVTNLVLAAMGFGGVLLKFRGDPNAAVSTANIQIGARVTAYGPSMTLELYEPWTPVPEEYVDDETCTAVIHARDDSKLSQTTGTWTNDPNYKSQFGTIPETQLMGAPYYLTFLQFDLSVLPRAAYSYLTKAVLKFTRLPTDYPAADTGTRWIDVYTEIFYSPWDEATIPSSGIINHNTADDMPTLEEYLLIEPARTVCVYEYDVTNILRNRAYTAFTTGQSCLTLIFDDDYTHNTNDGIDTTRAYRLGSREANMAPYLELSWDFSGISYYVDGEAGDDANDGITYQTPWRTITHAGENALPHTVINLHENRMFTDEPNGTPLKPANSHVYWATFGEAIGIKTQLININEPGTIEKLVALCDYNHGSLVYDPDYDDEIWDATDRPWYGGPRVTSAGVHYPLKMWFKLYGITLPVQHAEIRLWVNDVYIMPNGDGHYDEMCVLCRPLLNTVGGDTTVRPVTPSDTYMTTTALELIGEDGDYYGIRMWYWLTVDITSMFNANNNTSSPKWFGVSVDMQAIASHEVSMEFPMITISTDDGNLLSHRAKLVITP